MNGNNQKIEKLKGVEAEFVNPFLVSIIETMAGMGEREVVRGEPGLMNTDGFTGDVLIAMRVDGDLKGFVIVQIDENSAKKLVSSFLLGVPISDMDEMTKNSIREFSLRISEKARKILGRNGFHVNVAYAANFYTPITFPRRLEFIKVIYTMEYGEVEVYFNVTKSTQ